MKIALSILLMMILGFVNAQTFFFNQLVTIEKEVANQNGGYDQLEIQRLINASNSSYLIEFKQDSIAKLKEYKNDRFHDFKITNYGVDGNLEMMYLRTCDETELNSKFNESNMAAKTELIKLNENEFEFNSYQKKNSKNPFQQVKFKIEESQTNQLEILGKLSDELLTELSQHIDSTKFYSIKEISFWNDGKMHHSYRLKSISSARLKTILPSKLKMECIYPFLGFK